MSYRTSSAATKLAGPEAAKELALFQAAQVYAMKATAEKENLDCEYLLTREYEAFLSQEQSDEVQAQLEKEHNTPELDYIKDLQFVGPKFAEKVSIRTLPFVTS